MEVVKQRRQVSQSRSSFKILLDAYRQEGLVKVNVFKQSFLFTIF